MGDKKYPFPQYWICFHSIYIFSLQMLAGFLSLELVFSVRYFSIGRTIRGGDMIGVNSLSIS